MVKQKTAHIFGQPPTLPVVRSHRYGLVDFAVLPPGKFPPNALSIYPMHLEQVRGLSTQVKAPFTRRSFMRDVEGAIEAMHEFFSRHARFFTPAQSQTIQRYITEIEDLVAADQDPHTVISAASAMTEYWRSAVEGKVSSEELDRLIEEVSVQPMAWARIFRVRDHVPKLIEAGFDWYVFMRIHPPKEKLHHFLRVRFLYYREGVSSSLIFPVTFTPSRQRKSWMKGFLVFSPYIFRTIATVQRMGHVGASMADPTAGSDYKAVINSQIYSPEITEALNRAYRNVSLSYELRSLRTVPPGYRRQEAMHFLSAVELHLCPVHEIRLGEPITPGMASRFRWNYDLLYRLVYGVKYRSGSGFPDPGEIVRGLDTIYVRLQDLESPDYPAFRKGAIERIMELRSFAAKLPAFRTAFSGVFPP